MNGNGKVLAIHEPSLCVMTVALEEYQQQLLNKVFTTINTKLSSIQNYQDILVQASKKKLDVIFLPVGLNEEREHVVLKNLRSLQPDACIVIMSDVNKRDDALPLLSEGYANEHLLLPIEEEALYMFVKRVVKERLDFRQQMLETALASFVNLPVPERFQSKLKYLLGKEGVSINEIIAEMSKNPSLVAKILRIANSVHYATRSPIIDIREAIIFIGLNYLETLVMAVDLFERFPIGRNPQLRVHYDQLWNSSLRRALIAKNIAEQTDAVVDASTIHVAALLQDIGMLARLCIEPEKYLAMVDLMEKEQISLYIAEFRTFGTTHDEVGAALLRRWNFPHEVVFAVANHHGEVFANDIVRIVQLADALDLVGCLEPHDENLIPELVEWAEKLEPLLTQIKSQEAIV